MLDQRGRRCRNIEPTELRSIIMCLVSYVKIYIKYIFSRILVNSKVLFQILVNKQLICEYRQIKVQLLTWGPWWKLTMWVLFCQQMQDIEPMLF